MENEQCDKLTMEQDEIAAVTKNKSDYGKNDNCLFRAIAFY